MTIEDITGLLGKGSVRWTNHALQRMFQRKISRNDVIYALTNGQIIEQYPTDYPFPSCLVLGNIITGQPLHIVCGSNGMDLWIITVYYPNPIEWIDNFKQRRNV